MSSDLRIDHKRNNFLRDVRAVVFDAAETLITVGPSRAATFRKALQGVGLERESSEVNIAFKLAELEVSISELSGGSRREQRLRLNQAVLSHLGLSIDGLPEIVFQEFESTQRHWQAIDGAKNVFQHLRSVGLRIGVGSNFSERCSEILSTCDLVPDFLVVSAICGHEKPSEEFFTLVEKACSFPRSNCLFVGDSLRLDYLPSRAFGFKSLLFDEYSVFGESFSRLTNLNDLIPLLDLIS